MFLWSWVTFLKNFVINQFYVRASRRNWLWHLLFFGFLSLLLSPVRNLTCICPTSFLCFNLLFIVYWLIQSVAQFLPQLAQTAPPFSCSGLRIWTPSNIVTFPLEYDNCKGIKNVRLGIILLTQFRIGLRQTGLLLSNYYSMLYTYRGEQCTNARA